jgi:hypothetical protein
MPPSSQTATAPAGKGSISRLPPAAYWQDLASRFPADQVNRLRDLSDARLIEFTPTALPVPVASATELLDRVAADGWLERRQRQRCPQCKEDLTATEAGEEVCVHCNEAFSDHGGVSIEIFYSRNLPQTRDVDWVIAIHGMNTRGAWQEAFTWHLATTWGRSVPVAVYKYGFVIAGVIMAGRRHKLRENLRIKLAALRDEARLRGFRGKPDVIAHSFGTWLLGHLLEKELTREDAPLHFGRVILTGCILRPDFNWRKIKETGLVEEVLNHYGTKDSVVPLAQATIHDSGPSGRRGFDGREVINVRAKGCGHSDLFSITQFADKSGFFQRNAGVDRVTHLEFAYTQYWKPFLTLPSAELGQVPDRINPSKAWKQFPWLVRGTIFPFLAFPALLSLAVLLLTKLSILPARIHEIAGTIAILGTAGLASLITCIALLWVWRRIAR